MNTDSRMDRELRNLAALRPARSLWPELEKHLDRREKRQRRQSLLRYLLPGVAASIAVVVLVVINRTEDASRTLEIQKTVENAVRDARPTISFSKLRFAEGQGNLEALLVSAKPRRAEIHFIHANTAGEGGKPAAVGQEPIKEF